MIKRPEVSIVVPALNAAQTIAVCLRSLLALDFEHDQYEVLVADNGSTDETVAIAASFPVHVVSEPTKGSYAARNRGAQHARGEILAFTDSDCVADRSWLTHLVAGFMASDVGCVAGEVLSPSSATSIAEYARRRNLMSQLNTMSHSYLPYPITANCAYRAEVFRRLAGFREDMHSGGDADLAWRMQKDLQLHVKFIPDAIVFHHHRSHFRDLIHQSSKYARGVVDLADRHGLPRPPLLWRAAGTLKVALRACLLVPWFWVQGRNRVDRVALLTPLYDVAWRAGEVIGLVTWRKNRADRIPLA